MNQAVPDWQTRMAGERILPHNVEAERGLLGAILVDNRAHEKVIEYLRPEHFTTGPHTLIYEACATLIERDQIANPITLKPHFEQAVSKAYQLSLTQKDVMAVLTPLLNRLEKKGKDKNHE